MTAQKNRTRKNIKKQYSFEPKYLKHNVMIATGVLVVCLFVAAGVVERVVREMHSPFVAAVIASVLVDLTNGDRSENEVPELTVNPVLVAAAQAKADDMAAKGYFSHTSPEGYDSWYWFKKVGYDYKYAGENLAVNFSDSSEVEKAWMESPAHRQNIVSDKYTEIGIATAVGTYKGREAIFAVQMFGRPKPGLAIVMEAPREDGASPQESSIAIAPAPDVLGETVAAEPEVIAPHEEAMLGALAEQDGDASVMHVGDAVPWWGYLLASPRQTLQIAYYIIGLFILAALFFDVEWEIHKHHIRHAMKASFVLATMSMLFVVADWVFFAQPILALAQMFG